MIIKNVCVWFTTHLLYFDCLSLTEVWSRNRNILDHYQKQALLWAKVFDRPRLEKIVYVLREQKFLTMWDSQIMVKLTFFILTSCHIRNTKCKKNGKPYLISPLNVEFVSVSSKGHQSRKFEPRFRSFCYDPGHRSSDSFVILSLCSVGT